MLPSLLAHDIRQGLKHYLLTAYEPSDAFFHGIMSRFVSETDGWLKGPYLQIGLPFHAGESGSHFFSGFATEKPGYRHQEAAWQTLSSQHGASHALVATGTGSGKTECFLYPVLDHAARARQDGEQGIKALIIYPMNALANDQARRFAELVHTTPAFAGLRIGLFVGGHGSEPGAGLKMSATSVITDRKTLRKAPPDILLTNYKMLDYLLIRPKDRDLWASNTPTTLRYIVVDELHTFDGAQGTDLAMLIRRLRARLQIPPGQLICAGTSATLGNAADTTPLREYARQIFGETFPPEAVITENRLSPSDFLGDRLVDHVFSWHPDWEAQLEPDQYPSQAKAIAAWFGIFFPDLPPPADVHDPVWRQALGGWLKAHLLFTNLLKIGREGSHTFTAIIERFRNGGGLNESARAHAPDILNALLALVAWARSPESPTTPLVTLRVQLWLRELRRMVARVATDPSALMLRSASDLKSSPGGIYLPLIQCSQCHTTAWLTRMAPADKRVSQKLDDIYHAWFSGSSDVIRLYPGQDTPNQQTEGIMQHCCGECGTLQASAGDCSGCGSKGLVRVFRTTGVTTSTRGHVNYAWHEDSCPGCGERNRMLLIGARNATLGAQVIELSWGSIFNDDKKLIAFSDSVQDAAHRAGFFNARTYRHSIRTALAKTLDHLVTQPMPWSDFLNRFPEVWQSPASPFYLPPETFVSEFIGPNMVWQHDWANELLQEKGLPADSRLPARTMQRLLWDIRAEMTYLSIRGRTLERTGKAVLAPDAVRLDQAVAHLLPVLAEKLNLREGDPARLFQWLYGLLTHLRHRGAVWHDDLASYAVDGNIWSFMRSQGRGEWLPALSERSPRPILLSLGPHRHFDSITGTRQLSWYQQWLQTCLIDAFPLVLAASELLHREAVEALTQAGLLLVTESVAGSRSVALNPEHLLVHTDTAILSNARSTRRLTVPLSLVSRLRDMPCLDQPDQRYDHSGSFLPALVARTGRSDLRRVISAEHTGLLERSVRENLEQRFKALQPQPWYENVLSATPTLEMGVDIGNLSSVLLCSVPPNQASFLQRVGRAGRRDGNAVATTLADGNSAHDLYFFTSTDEMLGGEVSPPGIFLQATEVLRRQMMAFCLDHWVASGIHEEALPEKTSAALNAIENHDPQRFPELFLQHLDRHADALLQGFVAMLGHDITPDIRERLADYYHGRHDTGSLRIRLIQALEELMRERSHYKQKVKQLSQKIRTLKNQPQDEATKSEIGQFDREMQGAKLIIRDINQRELLGTLTDAGLIPNYAFPEAGIELKSVLWRRKASDDRQDRHHFVALPALSYERPAVSALSEFAPENRFYANQRRVEVDQINMNLARLEHWRLCPSCHHMENLELVADHYSACPRCGDVMWANVTQKRQLLRFRQAIANSDDTQVRIDDSADDREPKFYVRQLLVDFDNKDIREAWKTGASGVLFGFEFIASASFRDVNFGEKGKTGHKFKVADQEEERPGFRLCRHCGKVQTSQRSRRAPENGATTQLHAFDCTYRQSDDPDSLVECLYLYREFQSEALRIMVPYTRTGIDDEVIQSFMAALQFGLKVRYGGRVDHLRMTSQDEPDPNGGARRNYVLLYDSVPGGTGYLHQLLSHDAQTLIEVIGIAYEGLLQCSCQHDPDKDGCYRCLYQYRQRHVMEKISRRKAISILGELLESLKQMERVATISDMQINPNFDSALESSFIESLSRMEAGQGRPQTRLVQEIVRGRSGYLLEVNRESYWIEPQVLLGRAEGVAVESRPDFVLWPANISTGKRAVAVFCDGWAYHRDSLDADALKRSALVASGQFWVWSVTYEDVRTALTGDWTSDLDDSVARFGRMAIMKEFSVENSFLHGNAIGQLITWLGLGKEAMETLLRRHAAALTATFAHIGQPSLDSEIKDWWTQLPDWMRDPDRLSEPGTWASSRESVEPRMRLRWPATLRKPADATHWAPGVVALDPSRIGDEKQLHLAWRHWLRLYNLMQILPVPLMATQNSLATHAMDVLEPAANRTAGASSPASAWASCFGKAMSVLDAGMQYLADAALPPPDEIGYEWYGEARTVSAEAELCWLGLRIVVLMEHQYDYEAVWLTGGWKVVRAEGNWWERLSEMLKHAE